MRDDERLDQLVAAVLESARYRNVCVDFIRNIGRRELQKRRSLKQAVKATKNKLHQIAGAYFLTKPSYESWLEKLRVAEETRDPEKFRDICAEVMGCHQSTRERLGDLEEFYASLFSRLPPVRSIVDVACGFHPLGIPWMPLRGKVKYHAYDIYEDLMAFLGSYMDLVGVEGYAEARDVVEDRPAVKADLAFILNVVPCLEKIEKGAGLRVLESVNAEFLAVSFPIRSLCGKEKGMREYYEETFDRLTREKGWRTQQLEIRAELAYLIRKPQCYEK